MTHPRRTTPAVLVSIAAGALASVAGGVAMAAFTLGGMAPARAAPRVRDNPLAANTWREDSYEKIGLWERPDEH